MHPEQLVILHFHNDLIKYSRSIQKQIKKLNWLIESLLKMSYLETNIIDLSKEAYLLHDTVLSSIAAIELRAKSKNINIEFENKVGHLNLKHDSKWLQEAILNILDNAIKYSDNNTKIKVIIDSYEIFAKIDIVDSGPGINENEINKIFKRFYRGKNAKNKEGVGIGLYLAREIINGLDGYIKVKSETGKGSIFSIFLKK